MPMIMSTKKLTLRIVVRKLQRSLSSSLKARSNSEYRDMEEGHFVVIAEKGSEKKRFVMKLEWLKTPEFVMLLKLAEEEYGFVQTGALVVPCSPSEMERILRLIS